MRDVWVPSWLGSIPHVPLLIRSGGSDGKKERADAETPGERLALTAQQRRIMPGGPQLFDKFKCNVWL